MKNLFIILVAFSTLQTFAQSKTEYLEKNRFDLTSSEFEFPQKNSK